MVKIIKSEKSKAKDENSNKIREKNDDKNNNEKQIKSKETVLHKNIKEKRDFAKNQKVKDKHNKNKKLKNKNSEEEEEEEEKEKEIAKDEIENEEKEFDEQEEMEREENIDDDEEIEENNEEDDDELMEENEEQEEQEDKSEKESKEEEHNEDKEEENDESDNEESEDKKKPKKDLKLLKNAISEHYYTFQYPKDLYTLLYTSLIFKWIDTTKILILCNTPKDGYTIDLFLRQFRFNTIYLDKEMPINTNNHFYSQYLKNNYQICIINTEYSEKSKNFAKEILDNTKIPITIIYFDSFSQSLLEYHSFHPNTRSIYHFISNKDNFLDAYENLDENINFNEFEFDKEQMEHLRYRSEDMLNGIRKSDIKKEKMRKINIELLHSKKMQKFFNDNPKERENIIRNIDENTIKNFSPSVTFLPSYLIHSENNVIADAIKKEYKDTKRNKNKRRKKQKKMEQYFEALDKGDGSQNLIKF